MSFRVYYYRACLELAVLAESGARLPSTKVLPHERPTRVLYVPGTLKQVKALHLRDPHAAQHYTIYFPTQSALEAFWRAYQEEFVAISAAGGVVLDAVDNLLFIFKRGHWDLPKGKCEPDEKPETAALREIMEETGLEGITLQYFLMKTYHIYQERRQYLLKTVFWYLFRHPSTQPSARVQAEEGIEMYRWVAPSEVPFLYTQSYGTIRDVIEKVLRDVLPANS